MLSKLIIGTMLLLPLIISQAGAGSMPHLEKATFAGGCFWCMEPPFEKLDGVKEVISGYTGGHKVNPTYEEVSSQATGHLESVEVVYDPSKVTYEKLLDLFWRQINPTDDGGQFVDRGPSYKSAIFYHTEEQKRLAEASKKLGPFDIIFEATGFAPIVFEAMEHLGKNGVLILSSVTGGGRNIDVPADMINLGFVLGNKVVVGTVNANREYFEAGIYDLSRAEMEFPGWLSKLLTHPVEGLERYDEMMRLLTTARDAIKVFVNVSPE